MKEVTQTVDDIIIGERVDESGCCALFCLIDCCETDKMILMANVGDSCGHVYMQNNQTGMISNVYTMSIEHRPSKQNKEEYDRIINLGGLIYDNRVNGQLAVTRALGDVTLKPYVSNEPYCKTFMCNSEQHKYIVLGCDGLWDYVPSINVTTCMEGYIRDNLDFSNYARELVKQSMQNKSSDNISVIVIELF